VSLEGQVWAGVLPESQNEIRVSECETHKVLLRQKSWFRAVVFQPRTESRILFILMSVRHLHRPITVLSPEPDWGASPEGQGEAGRKLGDWVVGR
jgi:hypothetical protein